MRFEKFHFNELDSTMNKAKELLSSRPAVMVVSELQTAGRGRFGNNWLSPSEGGFYVTFGIKTSIAAENISGISLATGVMISRCLYNYHLDTALKWPNDVLSKESKPKKIAGILSETSSKNGIIEAVYLGIGINLYGEDFSSEPEASTIEKAYGLRIDKSELEAELEAQVERGIEEFLLAGFSKFASEWQEKSMLTGESISFKSAAAEKEMVGTVKGIDNFGGLVIEVEEEEKVYFPTDIKLLRIN